jgi:hypothetical protein
MLKKLLNFFVAKPPQVSHLVPAVAYTPPRDALREPSPTAPFYDELMAARLRDLDLAMAVVIKVDQWRAYVRMGNYLLVHPEYRTNLMKAMLEKDFEEQSFLYTLMQTNIMRNWHTAAQVRAL